MIRHSITTITGKRQCQRVLQHAPLVTALPRPQTRHVPSHQSCTARPLQSLLFYHTSCSCPARNNNINNNDNGKNTTINGDSSIDARDIIESAAATTQWKRNHYRKMEDKFANNNNDTTNDNAATTTSTTSTTSTTANNPLTIDNYEDVQPMWKEMESRVTRRRSLTLEQLKQRGGVSGRRNVRKTEEEVWLEAGVYAADGDNDDDDEKDGTK